MRACVRACVRAHKSSWQVAGDDSLSVNHIDFYNICLYLALHVYECSLQDLVGKWGGVVCADDDDDDDYDDDDDEVRLKRSCSSILREPGHTNRNQANNQANKQTSKQTNKQTNNRSSKRSRHTQVLCAVLQTL